MRIVIVDIPIGDLPLVTVKAHGLFGTALWRGDALPSVGTAHDVEIEVGAEVDWLGVVVVERPGPSAEVAEDELLLQGVVDDCDQDGVLTLRLAGATVLLDTTGEPPMGLVGRHVSVLVRDAAIFPTNL